MRNFSDHACFDRQLLKENPVLNAFVTSTSTISPNEFSPSLAERREAGSVEYSSRELIFELGLWLSGLESFLQIRNQFFGENYQSKAAARDWSKEFNLTNSALLRCSNVALRLGKIIKAQEASGKEANPDFPLEANAEIADFSFVEIFDLSFALKDAIVLNEALLRAPALKFVEWTAWSNILSEKLKSVAVTQKLIARAEREGEEFLPAALHTLLENRPVSLAAEADLRVILPLFAKILRWLDVIEKMLKTDAPLKSTLLLFARINEQTQAMIGYLNNRLRRFTNEEDQLFITLDCTVYAASIEVKKVYNFELAGLSEIRQSPTIRAKVETAHGLLNDCLQQIIVNFAQLIEPDIEPTKLFPNFQTKLEQSIALRRDLWRMQQAVQKAEKDFKVYPLERLHANLREFQKGSMRSLFYKDLETVERFIEEVMRTQAKTDVVPILHRFGAYLETLLGQVNMRTVLANHPFEYPQE